MSILTCIVAIQCVGGDFSSKIAIEKVNDDEINNSFGISTKIPGIEGSFAVIVTDDNGGVYVAYQGHWMENYTESVSLHVYFAYSHDYGKSWSESFRINDNESTSVQCDSPAIAIDKINGHIFVAWKDNRTGVANVYIDKSIDRGISFESDVKVSNSSTDCVPPWLPFTVNLLVGSDGKIYVTWLSYTSNSFTDCQILFTHSLDGGQTFNNPIILQSMDIETIFAHPWIAIDSKNALYVVYSRRDSNSANVYLVKSQNGGLSFETPIKVTDGSLQRYCGGTKASIAPDGTIHVVWSDNRAGDGPQYLDIYYATSMDNGQSFGPNIRVNDDLGISPPDKHPHFTRGAQGSPSIVIDCESTIHVVWEDFRNFVSDIAYCRDIYYASLQKSMQFSHNLKVNYVHPDVNSVNCADPSITIDSQDNFFIVYSDAPSGDNDHHSIYFLFAQHISETSSPIFGFQLITVLSTLLIVRIITKKTYKNR